MDVQQGRVIYVVAKFNGADAYFAIPWALMEADLQAGGYVVDQDKVKERNLQIDQGLPSEQLLDKVFLDRVFDTYQLPRYWEENQSTGNPPSGQSSSAGMDSEPAPEQKATASNPEASEGKGYGG